jgi:hypothetical protein
MPMKIHIYLDDMRPCPRGFVLARNVEEFMLLLENSEVGVVSLDHDLGWNEPNGLEAVRRMVEQGLYPQEIYLHSSNPVGRSSMYQLIYSHKPAEMKVHMVPLPEDVLERIARDAEKHSK